MELKYNSVHRSEDKNKQNGFKLVTKDQKKTKNAHHLGSKNGTVSCLKQCFKKWLPHQHSQTHQSTTNPNEYQSKSR